MKVTQEEIGKRKELSQALVTKAWKSSTFKERLINNPETVIAEFIDNKSFKSSAKIVVEDQTDPNIIYLNIPKKVNIDNIELTDEELELVSGGGTSQNGWNPIKWIGTGAAWLYDHSYVVGGNIIIIP